MKIRNLWGEQFGMLMASASPGSALAYHLGQLQVQVGILRRTTATETPRQHEAALCRKEPHPASMASPWLWLLGALGRFAERSLQRERTLHLAQSRQIEQLEARVHRLYRDPFLARARALR